MFLFSFFNDESIKFIKINFIENWMNYEAKMTIACGRILVSILEFCEFILDIFLIKIK